MPKLLQTFAGGSNVLSPAEFPEEAKWTAGAFGPSQTVLAGHVLAKSLADGLLYPYDGSNTNLATAGGLNIFTLMTDASNRVYYGGSTNASPLNVPLETSPYFVAGTFDLASLTGWDDGASSSLGAIANPSGFIRIG